MNLGTLCERGVVTVMHAEHQNEWALGSSYREWKTPCSPSDVHGDPWTCTLLLLAPLHVKCNK